MIRMNFNDIFIFTVMITIIIIFFYIWINSKIKHKLKKTMVVIFVIVSIIGFLFILDNLTTYDTDQDLFYQVVYEENQSFDLSYYHGGERSYLRNLDGTEVEYTDVYGNINPAKVYQVIYFKEIEEAYIVIYSQDIDKLIEYNRFDFPNYQIEREYEDRLYVIDKSTGKMILIRDYDNIGCTIDLDSISMKQDNYITYAILQTHQDYIRNLYLVYISDIDDMYPRFDLTNYYSEIAMSEYHFYSFDDPSWITYYAFTSWMSIWADSYGEVHGYYVNREANGYSGGYLNEALFENTFIADGYIISVDEKIYTIGISTDTDDERGSFGYSIYYVSSYRKEEVLRLTYSDEPEDISVIGDWISYIPQN